MTAPANERAGTFHTGANLPAALAAAKAQMEMQNAQLEIEGKALDNDKKRVDIAKSVAEPVQQAQQAVHPQALGVEREPFGIKAVDAEQTRSGAVAGVAGSVNNSLRGLDRL